VFMSGHAASCSCNEMAGCLAGIHGGHGYDGISSTASCPGRLDPTEGGVGNGTKEGFFSLLSLEEGLH